MAKWIPTTQPWIVCAACRRDDGIIVCGARHFDTLMTGVIRALDAAAGEDRSFFAAEQGFVDQFQRFYTREEAMQLARANDQVINYDDMLSETALHSEDLY